MYSMTLPSGSVAEALKVTVRGAAPLDGVAVALVIWGGWPAVGLRNHGVEVGSVLKKASSWSATLTLPAD